MTLSYDDALNLVNEQIGADLAPNEETVIEREWGWTFAITSRRFLETGDPNDVPVGLGSILVDRRNGSVRCFASFRPMTAWVEDYEQELRRTRPPSLLKRLLRALRGGD